MQSQRQNNQLSASWIVSRKSWFIIITAVVVLIGGVALALSMLNRPTTFDSPEAVGQAYVRAYETKDFSNVVQKDTVCSSYEEQLGLDTSEVEAGLRPLDVVGKVTKVNTISDSEYTVDILLTLSAPGHASEQNPIFIKVVKEGSSFRLCGEGSGKI